MRVRPLGQLLAVTAVSGVAALALSTPAGAQTYPVSPPPTPAPSASPADGGAGGGGGGGGTGTDAGGGAGGGGTGTDAGGAGGGGSLPRTGSDAVVPMAASGIALVLVGASVVVVARRRRLELDNTSFA